MALRVRKDGVRVTVQVPDDAEVSNELGPSWLDIARGANGKNGFAFLSSGTVWKVQFSEALDIWYGPTRASHWASSYVLAKKEWLIPFDEVSAKESEKLGNNFPDDKPMNVRELIFALNAPQFERVREAVEERVKEDARLAKEAELQAQKEELLKKKTSAKRIRRGATKVENLKGW